ncbi:MAG: hypothetical protein LH606_06570 [Cytophagaceae bacterium]|nr:hypothetical protein [Cytophagaceae bacterium]
MTTISISLEEEEVAQLAQKARELGYDSVGSFVQKTVQRLLETEETSKKRQQPSEQEFSEAMHYVLEKNTELYRRLA